jgi:hypothetical protein
MTYNCHSAAKREQFSTSDGDILSPDGRDANKKIMQRASSISRTASRKAGYLRGRSTPGKLAVKHKLPFFDDMV